MRKEFILVAAGAAMSVGFVQAIASETIVGQIKRVDGSAMISKGEHFVAAQQGMKLQELDRLMVLEQSEALLEFQDGCSYLMKEKELLTVGSSSVCADNPTGVTQAEGSAATPTSTELAAVQRSATSQIEAGAGLGLSGLGVGATTFALLGGGGLLAAFSTGTGGTGSPPSTSPLISPQ